MVVNSNSTQLNKFDNKWYYPGAGAVKRLLWYFTNMCFFSSFFPVNSVKLYLLRLFGARVGKGVIVKPRVNIKYPWNLTIGDFVWVGENVWIDNLTNVTIKNNCCISQGAFLLTGNHNYKSTSFDLIVAEILLEEGVWIGAKAIVCPGITCASHAVLTVGSVASKNLEPYFIYSGNPAQKVRQRIIA